MPLLLLPIADGPLQAAPEGILCRANGAGQYREIERVPASGTGVLHYDRDYDILRSVGKLTFDSVWLAPGGTL